MFLRLMNISPCEIQANMTMKSRERDGLIFFIFAKSLVAQLTCSGVFSGDIQGLYPHSPIVSINKLSKNNKENLKDISFYLRIF